MNIYENLQIVWSQFVTDMLLFVSIWSTSNIYWFIRVRYSMNEPEGKKTTIRRCLITAMIVIGLAYS
jgi:hypothetical protein